MKETTNFTKLIAVSIGHFINDVYMNLIPPILFVFASVMSLTLTEQGFIATVITSSGSFAQPIIGHFVDRRGKSYYLIFSVLWIAFWMSITGLIRHYFLLLVIVGIGALASALYHPLGTAIAVKLGTQTRGRSLSIFMTIGGFAASVAPLVAIPIVTNYGLDKLVYLMIPGFLIAGLMYLSQLQKVDFQNKEIKKEAGKAHLDFRKTSWVSVLVFIATNRNFIMRALLTFGVQLFLLKQIDVKVSGIILTLYLVLNMVGTIIGGYLSDIIGNKKVLIIFSLLSTLCIPLIVWGSGYILIFAFLLLGLFLNASNTANIVLTHDLIPENVNLATGLIMGLAGGLGGLGIFLYGSLADLVGLVNATSYLLVPMILVNIFTLLIPDHKHKEL